MAALITENQAKDFDERNLRQILAELESLSNEDAQKLIRTGENILPTGGLADGRVTLGLIDRREIGESL